MVRIITAISLFLLLSSCTIITKAGREAACLWCDEKKTPTPGATATPTNTRMPTKTPTPKNTAPFEAVEGKAVFKVEGIDKLDFSKQDANYVLFVLEWEKIGFNTPILGLHIRANYDGTKRGALIRWGANPGHDKKLAKELGEHHDLWTGGGMNFHHRIKPATDGLYTIEWNPRKISFTTPVGGFYQTPTKKKGCGNKDGTIAFGSFRTVLRKRINEPYLMWEGFDATRYGVKVTLVEWEGKSGKLTECP